MLLLVLILLLAVVVSSGSGIKLHCIVLVSNFFTFSTPLFVTYCNNRLMESRERRWNLQLLVACSFDVNLNTEAVFLLFTLDCCVKIDIMSFDSTKKKEHKNSLFVPISEDKKNLSKVIEVTFKTCL